MKHVNPYEPQAATPVERFLRRNADRRVAHLCQQPVRDIRDRREAFEQMLGLIQHAQDYAQTNPGKVGLVIGTGFYVAHDGEKFIVRKGAETFFQKSATMVAMIFDPIQFMSGHLDPLT